MITFIILKPLGIQWNFASAFSYSSMEHGFCYLNQVNLFSSPIQLEHIKKHCNFRWCNPSFYDGHPCLFQYLVRSSGRLGSIYEAANSCAQNFFVTRSQPSTIATIR